MTTDRACLYYKLTYEPKDSGELKNEGTMPGTTFAPLKVYGNFHLHSRVSNSKLNSLTSPKFKLGRDFLPVLIICKFDENLIKNMKMLLIGQYFPHYKSM